jgi:NodT family efflux transporter outer membrane factor (OMF) lipoprotein
MKLRQFLAVTASPLLLTACVAGPDYHRPDSGVSVSPSATQPLTEATGAAFVQDNPPDHWWELFDDPTANALVAEALSANVDLRVADANLRRATAIMTATTAQRTMSTTVDASLTDMRLEFLDMPTSGWIAYNVGAGLNLPLDLSGKIRRGIEAAQGDVEAAIAARDHVRVTIAAATMRAYADVCAANHHYEALEHILTVQRRSLDVTKRLAAGGRGTAFDVTRAQAAVEKTEADHPHYIAEKRAALYRLAALMGRPPADYPREAEHCHKPPLIKQALPTGDGAALLKRRPDIRAAERQLAADTARIGVVTADLYPQISLGGTLGLAGPIKNLGSAQAVRMNLGPMISWSFPNRRIARANIAQVQAVADASLAKFDGTILQALREVESNLADYKAELERHHALQLSRNSAALAEEQASKLYRFGRADFLQLLTAQNSLAQSEAALAASEADISVRQIALFLSLGGGWTKGGDAGD